MASYRRLSMKRSPDDVVEPNATPAAELASDAQRIADATRIAWEWHGTQTRKGKPTSYMSHLLQVAGLVIEAGGSGDETIAALLHDGLEDAPTPEARADREHRLRNTFGESVLRIVLDCTDTTPSETGERKGPWRERKERYLAQLAAADRPSRLVAACDKRQNLTDLVNDLRVEGPRTLERFNAGAEEQRWYFRGVLAACRPGLPAQLVADLEALVTAFETHLRADERA